MGALTRLPILLLTAILANYTPYRPPGGPSGVPGGMAECPSCRELSDWKTGSLFWCEDCGIWFDSDGKIYKRAGP